MSSLIALDLDGTVVNGQGIITPRTQAAIARAASRGAAFVIVTGRMFRSAAPFAEQLGLAGVPLVAYNGAMVRRWPSGQELHHQTIALAAARAVAGYCEASGYYIQTYLDDNLYVPELGDEAMAYSHHACVPAHPVGPISQFLDRDPTKLLVVTGAKQLPEVREDLLQRFGDVIQIYRSFPTFLDIVHPTVSKGRALAEVAAGLGFRQDQVIAMGDAPNDLPMLEWAGLAVAMSHAPPEVKAAADYVCQDTDGVAEALDKLIPGAG